MSNKLDEVIFLFIDESGTLPDPKDKVVIIASVGTNSPESIELIFKSLRKKNKFKKPVSEIKFYTAGQQTKELFFQKIVQNNFSIFILTVDKIGRAIPDTPENFSILIGLLLEDIFSFYPNIKEIVLDKHFSRDKDVGEFNRFLKNFLQKPSISLKHVDSKKNKYINVADMVAGAVLAKETGKTSRFYNLIRNKIISEKRLNWPEAKRRLFRKQKILSEPV